MINSRMQRKNWICLLVCVWESGDVLHPQTSSHIYSWEHNALYQIRAVLHAFTLTDSLSFIY